MVKIEIKNGYILKRKDGPAVRLFLFYLFVRTTLIGCHQMGEV